MSTVNAQRVEVNSVQTRAARRLVIPSHTRKFAANLLSQQLWCWGQDIRHIDGNLLLRYGFNCTRPPEGEEGSSTYSVRLPEGRTIMMWGFGIFCSEEEKGGVFIKRFSFSPRYTRVTELTLPTWSIEQLPEMRVPSSTVEIAASRDLIKGVLDWISRYERWVVNTLGMRYRRRCLKAWKKPVAAAEVAASEWQHIAAVIEAANARWIPRLKRDATE